MYKTSMADLTPLSPDERRCVDQWIQLFRLSYPIRKLSRDFSDGVLAAEILHQLFPRLVDLHNYTKGFAMARKLDNWETLNRKVLKKIGIFLTTSMVRSVAGGESGAVEAILFEIMMKSAEFGNIHKQ